MAERAKRVGRLTQVALLAGRVGGCAVTADRSPVPASPKVPAQLTPTSASYSDLVNLPPPRGPVLASVYAFRDQTGQYKKQPNSNFSTAVTQGAASMLVKALQEGTTLSVTSSAAVSRGTLPISRRYRRIGSSMAVSFSS